MCLWSSTCKSIGLKRETYFTTYLYGGGTGVCIFLHIFYFLLLSFNFSVQCLCRHRKRGITVTERIYFLYLNIIIDCYLSRMMRKTYLLFVEVIHQSLNVTEFSHLKGILALPGIVHPLFQGSAALLIMIQLFLLFLQVPQSGEERVGQSGYNYLSPEGH